MRVADRFGRYRRVIVAAAVVVALAFAGAAQAALSFAFARTSARPGELVSAYQADVNGKPVRAWSRVGGVTVYLVRLRSVPEDPLRRRPYPGAIRIGPLRRDRAGVWFVSFRLPPVRRGLYTTAFACRPCGGTFFASTLPGTPWQAAPGGRVLKVLPARR